MAINLNALTNGSTVRATGKEPEWKGTAIFDVLIKAVNENINIQLEQNRITGSDYSKVYLGSIETCIREAINFLLQKEAVESDARVKDADIALKNAEIALKNAEITLKGKEVALREAEIALKNAQKIGTAADAALKQAQADSYPAQSGADLAVKTAQVELYNKQKAGFDDNRRQKLFEATVNSWALAYSSGILDKAVLPSFINNSDMTALFTTIKNA